MKPKKVAKKDCPDCKGVGQIVLFSSQSDCPCLYAPWTGSKPIPSEDLRSVYCKAAEGIDKLQVIAEKIKGSDPEFHKRMAVLTDAHSQLLAWLNEKYEW